MKRPSFPSFSPPMLRGVAAVVIGATLSLTATLFVASRRTARTTERLNSAATFLDSLTDGTQEDHPARAAIAWGYSERMRLGLESPFRLIEAASRDPRLASQERLTVSWALLAHVMNGEMAQIDARALDEIGPREGTLAVRGEQHLRIVRDAIRSADNPRVAELALRLSYALAAAERIVEPTAPVIVAQAAALIADAEIARREAQSLVRSGGEPVDELRRRRARRAFYVERPALLSADEAIERPAIARVPALLDSIRALQPVAARDDWNFESEDRELADRLYVAGSQLPPMSPLAVTVRRYLTSLRVEAPAIDGSRLARARNGEMLVAVTHVPSSNRRERRAIARLLLSAGVAMRSMAQDPVWIPSDSTQLPANPSAAIGVADIAFDGAVPRSWRPYYVRSLLDAVADLRRVFPALRLDGLHVRFRMTAPADSALAMHDPRTRTLHLPVLSAGGTLSHELAHDIDRQNAQQHGLAGYRSDVAARAIGARGASASRLAASLRALTEELAQTPAANRGPTDRPAEIFATRVDWFVANNLARIGRSNGFLSAVEDELLTGHVVHPERLRGASRSRSLVTALSDMTTIAPFALDEQDPSAQTLLRWALAAPVDRHVAGGIVQGSAESWEPETLLGASVCSRALDGRALLVRMAAESRARGWLRLRARWLPEGTRPAWARAALGQLPWESAQANGRIAALRDYVLVQLATGSDLPSGLTAYAAPFALEARCST